MRDKISYIDGYKFLVPVLIDVDMALNQYKVFVNCDKRSFLYMTMKLDNKEKSLVYEDKENTVEVYVTFIGNIKIEKDIYRFEVGFTPCELVL